MNNFLNMLQGISGMQLRFRDILQMLLLSAAVRIAARIYETLNRLSGTQALPMNPMYQNPLMLGYIPPAQIQMFGFPAANAAPQQPEIIPFIDPNQKGV
ncbi:MAG: hypothetical protein K5695_01535 [Oscillospiraceae bacterium]|nr:hypothetical protein [Oscillospiraceae bacterium]